MRALYLSLPFALLVACAPSAAELRTQRLTTARSSASQLAGPRQAAELADAIHAAAVAGDYRTKPAVLQADVSLAIATIDRAVPSAGVDAPMLVAWRAMMFGDLGKLDEMKSEFERSFAIGPNKLAGRNLVAIYGALNDRDKVGQTCNATIAVLRGSDERLDLIAMCRRNMNAATPEGEMQWMSPELVTWYQAENASRLQAEIDADNARRERDRQEQRVVRQTEQCAATCKERGLYCQNRCDDGDQACDNRCVEANHACLDRCESRAYEKLDQ